jgi:HAD superfamily hydrolase (TIGR01509 family)
MPKCLLFDCDGTLVDSEMLNCEAMSAELARTGIIEDAPSLLQRYRGRNLHCVLEDLQQCHGVTLDQAFSERFRGRAADHFSQHLKAVSGVREALDILPHQCSVVSNAPLAKIAHELSLTDLSRYFGGRLYSAYDVGHWKPDPRLFTHAAEKEGFSAADCVVIEDSLVGVQAALSADMSVVMYDPSGQVSGSGATETISSMQLLPAAIARILA